MIKFYWFSQAKCQPGCHSVTFLTMVLFIESKHIDVVMWEMTDDSKNIIGGNSYWI